MKINKKAALHNLGCKVNAYETEAMQQILENAGYEIVPFTEYADVYVVNTCSVTNMADRKSRQMLHKAKKMNPDAIVVGAGCYVQTKEAEALLDDTVDIVIGNNKKHELLAMIEAYENDHGKCGNVIAINHEKKEYEEMFGSNIWREKIGDADFESYIKDQIKSKLMRVKAMNVKAKERGVVLGREEKDSVGKAVDAFYNELTESQISSTGITKDKLNTMFTEFAIAQKLYDDLTSSMDIEVSADEARVIDIQYIVSDSEEDINKAYNLVNSGSSFFAVAKEYNADGEYEYELKRGEMDAAFEKAAFNLSTGEMSSIVESAGRYYIIRCTSDNDKAKTEVNKSAILEKRKLEQFNTDFEKYEAGIYMEFNNSEWKKLSIQDAYTLGSSFEDTFNAYFGK